MGPYIGTSTSRVDGFAKVTGAAKYAAEFNVPGLAYGSVVTSTIANGRIARIDRSAALRVKGVLDVLTHENRPPMADNDQAYNDETAPAGSPFRPLYDSKVMFNGQPIALVAAETSEIARFAASLVRVEYETDAHITDVYRRREAAIPVRAPANPIEAVFTPPKTRGRPKQALAAAAVRHAGEYYVPIEHHNPMELYASTVIYDGSGKLTVYDKTQGVQNVQHYLCGVFGMEPEDVRVMSPFVGGGFGSGLRPQFEVVLAVLAARALRRSVRVVLTRPQMYVLGYRPAMIQRIELGANTGGTLDAIMHDAITVTRNTRTTSGRRPAGRACCTNAPMQNTSTSSCGSILRPLATCAHQVPQPPTLRSNPRWTSLRLRSSSIRSNSVCDVILSAIRTTIDRSAVRRCANATARAPRCSAGTNAIPRCARCGTPATWSAGAWRPACGRRCRCRSLCVSC
jgi:CO/xanthine dehydrogenase Mo-binding subunit